jgi:hypothetical protein
MWNNQVFSLITPTKVDVQGSTVVKNLIQNIIVCDNYEVANQLSVATYGEGAIAVDTTLYPVGIGDEYRDGVFYSVDGEVVNRNLTEAENIVALQSELVKAKADNITALEAIAALYEKMSATTV